MIKAGAPVTATTEGNTDPLTLSYDLPPSAQRRAFPGAPFSCWLRALRRRYSSNCDSGGAGGRTGAGGGGGAEA